MFRRWAVGVAALAACACACAQSYPYVIDDFDVDVRINGDATIDVRETIAVTFNEARHGIYRTIPVVYDAGRGRQRALQLKITGVTDGSGSSQGTKITREGDYLKIRIGDADVLLDAGTSQTYVVSYKVFGALNWFNDSSWHAWTELYWNVTGDQWDTTILRAKFHVTFPTSDEKEVRGSAFAGAYGSRASAELVEAGDTDANNPGATSLHLDGQAFSGTRETPLGPYEGLTFVLGVPEGSVPRPAWWVEFFRRASEYLALLTPFAVLLVMVPIWMKAGRDRSDGPTQVRFEPPAGLPPAEAGTMLDERVDQRDLAAGIMSLCVKGYLTVEVTEKGGFLTAREYVLHLTEKKDTTGLSRFESELYDRFAIAGDPISKEDLRDLVAPHMPGMISSIYTDLVDRGLYHANPSSVRSGAIVLGVLLAALLGWLLSQVSLVSDTWVTVVGIGLGCIPAAILGYQMPKRTVLGHQVRRETLGFYEMMRYRKNYMAWVVDKQPDGLKYEEYLPYAVAFDLIEQWNDAFKDIVHEAPRWYHDPYGGTFYPMMFASDLRTMASSLGAAAATPPRSSGASGGFSGFGGGGGGGGFSGGGFGGGGGGSW